MFINNDCVSMFTVNSQKETQRPGAVLVPLKEKSNRKEDVATLSTPVLTNGRLQRTQSSLGEPQVTAAPRQL